MTAASTNNRAPNHQDLPGLPAEACVAGLSSLHQRSLRLATSNVYLCALDWCLCNQSSEVYLKTYSFILVLLITASHVLMWQCFFSRCSLCQRNVVTINGQYTLTFGGQEFITHTIINFHVMVGIKHVKTINTVNK